MRLSLYTVCMKWFAAWTLSSFKPSTEYRQEYLWVQGYFSAVQQICKWYYVCNTGSSQSFICLYVINFELRLQLIEVGPPLCTSMHMKPMFSNMLYKVKGCSNAARDLLGSGGPEESRELSVIKCN